MLAIESGKRVSIKYDLGNLALIDNMVLLAPTKNIYVDFVMKISFHINISALVTIFSPYIQADSDVCKMGRRLEAFFDSLLSKYAPDVNHYPDSELRKRRKEDILSFK